jgi:glycogen synthase
MLPGGIRHDYVLDAAQQLDLQGERHLLDQDDLRGGSVGFLKTGIHHADALTTVSETYAREIQTSELGMGLDNALRARSGVLQGISQSRTSSERHRKSRCSSSITPERARCNSINRRFRWSISSCLLTRAPAF